MADEQTQQPPVTPSASTPPDSGKSSLTPDQQKVASALAKGDAATQSADGNHPQRMIQPKVHKTIFTAPPADLLEKELDTEGAPEDLTDDKEEKTTTGKTDTTKETKPAAAEKGTKVDKTTVKPTVEVPQVKPGDAKAFDYTGFTTEEAALLKQMSNQAREYTAKTIKSLKELQGKAPDIYFQHPEAYVLDPQYKELGHQIDFAAREAQHWKNQLINIRTGKPWMALDGWDEQGRPILRGPIKPTDEHEIDISNALQVVTGQMQQLQQQRQGFPTNYAKQVAIDNGVLKAEMEKRFEWVKDPAKLEEKVDIGNSQLGPVPIKQIQQDFRSLFAGYHQSSPILDVAANLFVALQIYGARIRELEGATQHERRIKEDVLASEPSPDNATTNGKGAADKGEFNMEGLPE